MSVSLLVVRFVMEPRVFSDHYRPLLGEQCDPGSITGTQGSDAIPTVAATMIVHTVRRQAVLGFVYLQKKLNKTKNHHAYGFLNFDGVFNFGSSLRVSLSVYVCRNDGPVRLVGGLAKNFWHYRRTATFAPSSEIWASKKGDTVPFVFSRPRPGEFVARRRIPDFAMTMVAFLQLLARARFAPP
jgi:hypothetical protein